MKEEITLTNKFSYESEVKISNFANKYNKLSWFGNRICHSKMKCENLILNNYEEYYIRDRVKSKKGPIYSRNQIYAFIPNYPKLLKNKFFLLFYTAWISLSLPF